MECWGLESFLFLAINPEIKIKYIYSFFLSPERGDDMYLSHIKCLSFNGTLVDTNRAFDSVYYHLMPYCFAPWKKWASLLKYTHLKTQWKNDNEQTKYYDMTENWGDWFDCIIVGSGFQVLFNVNVLLLSGGAYTGVCMYVSDLIKVRCIIWRVVNIATNANNGQYLIH